MWASVIGRIAGFWHILDPEYKGFILGLVVGLTALSLSCGTSANTARLERIGKQNAEAALDSTRKLTSGHDTVYARLIAQKDVELAGALRKVASSQGTKPRAVVTVTIGGRGLDTTASHRVQRPSGLPVGNELGDGRRAGPNTLRDSLRLPGPPVEGVVTATATDSIWLWSARLRPSPVNLTLAITCGKKGPEVLAHGPDWIGTSVDAGQVDPTVCNPKPSRWVNGFKSGVVVTAGTYVVFRVVRFLLQKGN